MGFLMARASRRTEAVGGGGTPQQRLSWLSTHEAGHAIAAWYSPAVGELSDIVVEPTRGGPGLWQGRVKHDWARGVSESERLAWDVVISLAGLAAEVLCYGQVRSLLLRDLDDAIVAARTFCRRGVGWPLGPGSSALPFAVRCSQDEARVLDQGWASACAMVAGRRQEHGRLASAIAEHRRMSGRDVAAILGS
jgi:hypothetical protein